MGTNSSPSKADLKYDIHGKWVRFTIRQTDVAPPGMVTHLQIHRDITFFGKSIILKCTTIVVHVLQFLNSGTSR